MILAVAMASAPALALAPALAPHRALALALALAMALALAQTMQHTADEINDIPGSSNQLILKNHRKIKNFPIGTTRIISQSCSIEIAMFSYTFDKSIRFFRVILAVAMASAPALAPALAPYRALALALAMALALAQTIQHNIVIRLYCIEMPLRPRRV